MLFHLWLLLCLSLSLQRDGISTDCCSSDCLKIWSCCCWYEEFEEKVLSRRKTKMLDHGSCHCHWCRRTNGIHPTGLTDVVLWVLISSSPGQLQIRLLTEISSGIISCLTDNCKIWSLLFGSHLDWPVRFLHQMVSLFKNKFPFLLLFFRRAKCKI